MLKQIEESKRRIEGMEELISNLKNDKLYLLDELYYMQLEVLENEKQNLKRLLSKL